MKVESSEGESEEMLKTWRVPSRKRLAEGEAIMKQRRRRGNVACVQFRIEDAQNLCESCKVRRDGVSGTEANST